MFCIGGPHFLESTQHTTLTAQIPVGPLKWQTPPIQFQIFLIKVLAILAKGPLSIHTNFETRLSHTDRHSKV